MLDTARFTWPQADVSLFARGGAGKEQERRHETRRVPILASGLAQEEVCVLWAGVRPTSHGQNTFSGDCN